MSNLIQIQIKNHNINMDEILGRKFAKKNFNQCNFHVYNYKNIAKQTIYLRYCFNITPPIPYCSYDCNMLDCNFVSIDTFEH